MKNTLSDTLLPVAVLGLVIAEIGMIALIIIVVLRQGCR